MSWVTTPRLGVFRLVEGTLPPVNPVTGLSALVGLTAEITVSGGFPFPACPLNEVVSQAQAETWYDNEAGIVGVVDGMYYSVQMQVLRPGQDPTISGATTNGRNRDFENAYRKAFGTVLPSDLPELVLFEARHRAIVGGADNGKVISWNKWGYVLFENIDYWHDTPLQIDWLAFDADLFNLGGGLEICCAAGQATASRSSRGHILEFEDLDSLGGFPNTTQYVGDPPSLPAVGDTLYTITSPEQLPVNIPVPAGRAIMVRTVNQDPQSMALGSAAVGEVRIGFLDPDPACAFKVLRSDAPSATVNWTAAAISEMRLKGLAHAVDFGGAFDYRRTVLVYRDPARVAGDTLRFPLTGPFLWFTEDPDDTFFGGGMEVTLEAFAVDESELVGTPEENWQNVIKGWGYADVEARIGASLATKALVTLDENTFTIPPGDFDVDVSGGRRLVYYKLTSVATPGFPTAGLHLPSILHSNPSLF